MFIFTNQVTVIKAPYILKEDIVDTTLLEKAAIRKIEALISAGENLGIHEAKLIFGFFKS